MNEGEGHTINMQCILMSEAVIVPSLKMMASTVSEKSLMRDTHARTNARTRVRTHTHRLRVYMKIKSLTTLKHET